MRPDDQTERIDSGQWMEMYNLMRALLRRVEILEKQAGIGAQSAKPCTYCNTMNVHQEWCPGKKSAGGR